MQVQDIPGVLQQRLQGLSDHEEAIQRHANDVDILALTMFGEARNESLDGRVGVAWTAYNRWLEKGRTVAERCLQNWQYSCWKVEGGAANHARLMKLAGQVLLHHTSLTLSDAALFVECRHLAAGVLDNSLRDNTFGSTHYCTLQLFKQNPPKWAKGQPVNKVIGQHIFFRDIPWS